MTHDGNGERPSGIRLTCLDDDASPPGHLVPFRRVTYDDVLARIPTLYIGAEVPSALGGQLEQLRDGLFGGAADAIRKQGRQELLMVRGDPEGDCARALAAYASIRWPGCPCDELRTFAGRVKLPEGAVAVGVLMRYQPWALTWPMQGLVDTYEWLRKIDENLRPLNLDSRKSTAQQFREGKMPKAQRIASELIADAQIVLHAWVERWNRRLVGRARAAA